MFRNDDGEFWYFGNDWYVFWLGNCKFGFWIFIVLCMGVLFNIFFLEDVVE